MRTNENRAPGGGAAPVVRSAWRLNNSEDSNASLEVQRQSLLAGMRCVTLRLRLLQSEVDQLGIFLRNGWIAPEQVEAELVDLRLIDLAYPPSFAEGS